MKGDSDFIVFSSTMELDYNGVAVKDIREHPYMEKIRQAVRNYRLQSAVHFDVDIRVEQVTQFHLSRDDWATDPSFHIKVKFADYNGPITHTVRPKFRTDPKKNMLLPQDRILVMSGGRSMSIDKFLGIQFPAFKEKEVTIGTMQSWWNENGKQFNWSGLPTELKQLVLQNCLHQPMTHAQYKEAHGRHQSRRQPRAGVPREFGIFEIINQLGDWASVLKVSHQVRAIALRLCFMGANEMVYNKGFCFFTRSLRGMRNALSRLGRYYQMTSANGLPTDEETLALAENYKYYPKIYKHIDQYSTFGHGIRRICINMDFFDLMCFFKVTTGDFSRYIEPESISYEVFDRLPNLVEISIELPDRPRKGWSNLYCRGPFLFHDESPCPRTLHRLIYERIAECLVLYPQVIVQGFIDDEEQARFESLRGAAMKESRWTTEEFDELYAECGGGVQLDQAVVPGSWLPSPDEEDVETMTVDEPVTNDFFPPKCDCAETCLVVVNRNYP